MPNHDTRGRNPSCFNDINTILAPNSALTLALPAKKSLATGLEWAGMSPKKGIQKFGVYGLCNDFTKVSEDNCCY